MTQTTSGDLAGLDCKATVEKLAGIVAEASALDADLRAALAKAPPPAPFHERSEFKEAYERLRFVSLGIAAMKGIGGMMRTGMDQMNAGGHEAGYVFEFFGEALEGPAQAVHDAIEQLQWAAKREAA